MMRAARKQLGLSTSETVMIGDTMETDILSGVQIGYRTILVLSGGTSRSDLARYAYRPDVVVPSIADLCDPTSTLRASLPIGNPDDDTPHDLGAWIRHRA